MRVLVDCISGFCLGFWRMVKVGWYLEVPVFVKVTVAGCTRSWVVVLLVAVDAL